MVRRLGPPREGFVYFIQSGGEDGPVKIGWALNPTERMVLFQTGNPEPLTMLAFGPGTQDDERHLHRRFARSHVRGEWFWPTPSVMRAAGRYDKKMKRMRAAWKAAAAPAARLVAAEPSEEGEGR